MAVTFYNPFSPIPAAATASPSIPSSVETEMAKKFAELLMGGANDSKPIQSHWEGANKLAQGALSGMVMRKMGDDEKTKSKALAELLMGAPGLGGSSSNPASTPPAIPSGVSSAGNPADPRGIRNNNPLNIEAGNFTQGIPGYQGSDGRFARFENMDQGIQAADKLLGVYSQKHGLNTIAGIVNRWAPPSDGNNVSAYANNVAKQMGVDPNAPLDMQNPEVRRKLILAMGQHENGRPIPIGQQPMAFAPQQPPQGPQLPPQVPGMTTQMAQAAPQGAPAVGRAQPQMPPQVADYVRRLIASGQPQAMALAQQYITQYTKPIENKFSPLGDNAILNTNTGEVRPANIEKKTDDIREYERAKTEGYTGTLQQFIIDMKKAGAATNAVNIDQKAEGAFSQAVAKHQAERFDKIVQSGFEAKANRGNLQALRDIGTRITTGKNAEILSALGPYAEMFGAKIDGLGDLQAYEAIVAKMAPAMRPAGAGATSDFEMQQYLKALPGLGKTPEGNMLIEQTMEALQNHQEAAAEIASRAMSGEIPPKEAEKQLRSLPDPLTAYKEFRKKAKADAADGGGWTDMGNGIEIREKK